MTTYTQDGWEQLLGLPPFRNGRNRPDDMSKKDFPQSWTQDGKGFWGVAETTQKVPAGTYVCAWSHQNGPVLAKHTVVTDNLIMFEDTQSQRLSKEFINFWKLKSKYKALGFLHKRGYLFWGPPGSGKTSLINLLMKQVIEKLDGIVVFIKTLQGVPQCLQMIRNIEPDRPMFVILEDIDSLVVKNEKECLAILDGSTQIDNVVFVATTNYPENLDARFVDRPSRFDRIEHIDMPSTAQRAYFIRLKASGLKPEEIREWAQATKGLSIAHLRELIVAVQCLGQPLDDVVARLKKMHETLPKSKDTSDKKQLGFRPASDDDDDDEDEDYDEYEEDYAA